MELFDSHWYASQVGDGIRSADMIMHYRRAGKFRGFNPSPYFDTNWYANAANIALSQVESPIDHFIEFGGISLCDPHPLFNARWYKWNYMGAEESSIPPLMHYITVGWRQGAKPHPLFWSNWYRKKYLSDDSDTDPFYHFLVEGERRNYDPNPLFSVRWYRSKYYVPSLENSLKNYIYGGHETRDPHFMFNSTYYRSAVSCDNVSPLEHYLTRRTGVDPCTLFDAEYFSEQYNSIPGAKLEDDLPLLVQYIESSRYCDIDPHPLFSKRYYFGRYSDVRASGIEPFEHYMRFGFFEKRQLHPLLDPDHYLDLCPAARGRNPHIRSLTMGLVRILLRAAHGPRIRRRGGG